MSIAPAELAWDDSGAPFNTRFGDIYFSVDGGNEVHRVFIEPAGIAERMDAAPHFTVAELGFGSGLNFVTLAAAALAANCRLHFISVELTPFRRQDLERTRARYRTPDETGLLQELIDVYPPLLPGWHRRSLAQGRVTLTLRFGDVAEFLPALQQGHAHGIDAWLLDGFAPDRNPRMWEETLFASMAAVSRRDATVTTFTSAGHVRRGLERAGFRMRRIDQRPMKRESLAGVLAGPGIDFIPPRGVQVLGGGIAGCSVAAHLATQGVEVRLLEPLGALATNASRMCATQHARLLADDSPQAEWRSASHLYSLAFTRGLLGVDPVGAVQLPGPNASLDRLRRVHACYGDSGDWVAWLGAEEIASLAGPSFSPATAGLWFPKAPIVDLATLCHELAHLPGITLEYTDALEPGLPTVFACAQHIGNVAALAGLPVHSVWGQVDRVTMEEAPRIAVLGDGYLLPRPDGVLVGSTYEYSPWDAAHATAVNLSRLGLRTHSWVSRQRAPRLIAPDRMPIVGRHGEDWISTAHGSMGATSAHLAAAVVSSGLLGWIAPVGQDVLATITPTRFAERAAKRAGRLPSRQPVTTSGDRQGDAGPRG